MSPPAFAYSLFGLTIESTFALPELVPAGDEDRPVIRIDLRSLPDDLPEAAGLHQLDDSALLVIDGAGRYLVRQGREIVVEAAAGVTARNLRLFLLGSALGLLLHQRGLLPLHANAVVIEGRAYAFTGPSGSGKSTLAAWFSDHGCPLLCDDVCVIGFSAEGAPLAWPGLPRLRLWRDALERSGREVQHFERSFDEDDEWEKYDVPLARVRQQNAAVPLGGVFLLERGEPARVEQLEPAAAMQTLFASIYRGEFLSAGQHAAAWRSCVRVAEQRPVSRWFRPWEVTGLDAAATVLLNGLSRKTGR